MVSPSPQEEVPLSEILQHAKKMIGHLSRKVLGHHNSADTYNKNAARLTAEADELEKKEDVTQFIEDEGCTDQEREIYNLRQRVEFEKSCAAGQAKAELSAKVDLRTIEALFVIAKSK